MAEFGYKQEVVVNAEQYRHGVFAPGGTVFCYSTHGHIKSGPLCEQQISDDEWVIYDENGDVMRTMSDEEFEKHS
jgi:hypothetical protein